jgi:hypothetical protein
MALRPTAAAKRSIMGEAVLMARAPATGRDNSRGISGSDSRGMPRSEERVALCLG